jgi:Ca2+/Na+ antiporter
VQIIPFTYNSYKGKVIIMATTTTKNTREPLLSIIGLILIVALIWFVRAVIKGVVGIVLTVLFVVAAALLVWRLIRAVT